MDRRTIVSLSLGVFSIACAAGGFDPSPSQLVMEPLDGQGPSVVMGVIHDAETGKTIKGSLVILQCSCLDGYREFATSANGIYIFRDLPPGKYTVQVLFEKVNVNRSFDMARGVRVQANFRVSSGNVYTLG
jgi:hypothetical protein